MARFLRLLALAALLCGLPDAASARRMGRTSYSNKQLGIRIFLPTRWVQQMRSGYPGLLASFEHPLGARFLISVATRQPNESPTTLANRNTATLRKRGWTVKPPFTTRLGRLPAKMVDGVNRAGTMRIRQIYAVQGKHAFVLTLSVPDAHRGRLATDLRYILKTARFAR